MQKKALYPVMLLVCMLTYGQNCSSLNEPLDGDVDVPVDTKISWSEIPDIIGYVVSFGTAPGAGDIIEKRSSGLRNFYIPETGLPANTQIYVTISYFKEGQDYTTCNVESFRTAAVTSPPDCTEMVMPLDGADNIVAETKLEWNYSATATGYLLSVGTTSNGTEIFENLDLGNVLSFEPPDGLPADLPIYVTLTPYNHVGKATSCPEESFTTTSVVIDCGPFFDHETGQSVSLGPEIEFPDEIGLCKDQAVTTVESSDIADGYRWYAVNLDGTETLLSSTKLVELSKTGNYRYEAFNLVTRWTKTVECANSKPFTVKSSESAIISSIDENQVSGGRTLNINVIGEGEYEYALDNKDGPYQDSSIFENVSSDFHYVYVRDKNGCGITESSVQRNLSPKDFPKFFTPNGDNVNEFWQYLTPEVKDEIVLIAIYVFDRYGNLIVVVDPESSGWDGTYRGRRLPSSDYWFRAVAHNGKEIRGHFSLKR